MKPLKQTQSPLQMVFHRDAIEVKLYPFAYASVKIGTRITPDMIAAVRLQRTPPEIVLKNGEVIFCAFHERVFLQDFAALHAIPCEDAVDVWALLCHPFLGRDFTEEEEQENAAQLLQCGLTSAESNFIRAQISKPLRYYNGFVWESNHLGHYDVLNWVGKGHCGSGWKFWQRARKQQAFYQYTHEIAGRSPAYPAQEASVSTRADTIISEAIRDVAYHFMQAEEHWAYVMLLEKITPLLYDAYGSLDRQYHNLLHIAQMLHISQGFALSKRDRAVLRCAILFHDIVYDVQAKDNEERSAEIVRTLFAGNEARAEDVQQVVHLIEFTKNYVSPVTQLEQCMADADLAIFSEDGKTYQRYVMNIRREYAHVDETAWRAGRLAFLLQLKQASQQRGFLYHVLPPFYEAQAQRNLETEIAQWQALVSEQAA